MADVLEFHDSALEAVITSALKEQGLQEVADVGAEHYTPATQRDGQSGAGSFSILWGDDTNLDIYRGDDIQRIDQRVFVIFRHSLAPKDKKTSRHRARQAAVNACNALMTDATLALHGYRCMFVSRTPALVDEGNTYEQRAEMSIVYDRGAL